MKIIVLLSLIVAVLSGCSREPELPPLGELTEPQRVEAVPAETVGVPQAPTIDLAEVSRDAYLSTMGREYPALTEAQLLDFADYACAELALSDNLVVIARSLAQERTEIGDLEAAAVLGSAVGSGYCDNTWTGR